MILPTILSTVQAKLFLGLTTIFGVILAAGEASSDRTLIKIAIGGWITTILVALAGAGVSVYNARKLSGLPGQVHQLEIKLDGGLKELLKAEKAASHAEGIQQERTEERGRKGDEAIGLQAATPAPVIVANPKENPAHVKPVE